MYQQLWGYIVEERIYLGVRERRRLNITAVSTLIPVSLTTNTGSVSYVCHEFPFVFPSLFQAANMNLMLQRVK